MKIFKNKLFKKIEPFIIDGLFLVIGNGLSALSVHLGLHSSGVIARPSNIMSVFTQCHQTIPVMIGLVGSVFFAVGFCKLLINAITDLNKVNDKA